MSSTLKVYNGAAFVRAVSVREWNGTGWRYRPAKRFDGSAWETCATDVVIGDTFSRADSSTSLGSAETGQAWTVLRGTWGVLSARARVATVASGGDQLALVDSGVSNVRVGARIYLSGLTSNTGIVARSDGTTSNLLYAWVGNGNSVRVGQVVAGSFTALANVPATWAEGDRLEMVVTGNTVELYQNTTLRTTVTANAALAALTQQGLLATATGTRQDDFRVKRLV